MTRVIITGAKGRMGQALAACAKNFRVEIVAQVDMGDDLPATIADADVVIDFSEHAATAGITGLCARHKKAIVIGTTGHSKNEQAEILKSKTKIPIVWTSNFSTGVNTLFWLTQKAAEILGPDFDLEIIEMHHRLKKDAPSGTAKTLAEILAAARKQSLEKTARYGRMGIGERAPGEIGIHSLRGGDVVGDHTVVFANNGERLELIHKASSREAFANGALRAALWVVKQKPGLYDMQDVLGLK
ncbi:MAG TPA: 4-hydroxy-tetrahydrodipicolinate reductase [Candidatus Aquilonibacter sp.]|nr:4-hydroxy-tetrahydrodipicolinate reductase [Candidatus Aquilonibacter sp.]